MGSKNQSFSIIIATIIATVIAAFIISYFSSSSPILFVPEKCPNKLSIDDDTDFSLNVENKEDVTGFATLCLNSSDLYFKANRNWTYWVCFVETVIPPKKSGLKQPYSMTIKLSNITKTAISFNVHIACNQKIWGLISKQCDDISYPCNYKKGYKTYVLDYSKPRK